MRGCDRDNGGDDADDGCVYTAIYVASDISYTSYELRAPPPASPVPNVVERQLDWSRLSRGPLLDIPAQAPGSVEYPVLRSPDLPQLENVEMNQRLPISKIDGVFKTSYPSRGEKTRKITGLK